MNMKYHFYGIATDLYTNALERTPALYSKGQLSMKSLKKLSMVVTNMWQSYIRGPVPRRYPSISNRICAGTGFVSVSRSAIVWIQNKSPRSGIILQAEELILDL
jgi:hypothetical protein